MAIKVGPTLSGLAVASVRGGSNPLGGSRVILGTISKEGLVSSSVQPFSNPRGEQFSNFLKSVKGSDGGAAPLFPHQNLSAKQTEVIKGANPSVNTEPVEARIPGSAKNKQSVAWFGPPIPNRIPEKAAEFGQPKAVEKPLFFSKPKAEAAPTKSTVNNNEVSVSVSRVTGVKLENVDVAESVKPAEFKQRRALSIVERVNIAMIVKNARASMLKPQSQAIAMAGAESEAAGMPVALAEQLPAGKTANENKSALPLKAETQKKVKTGIKRTKVVPLKRKSLSTGRLRTRFVERDQEMNAWRLKALIKGYDELQQENRGGDVDGAALAAKSQIGSSRELRSVFLDQRGYRDRQDGSQKRMELFLSSVNMISKEQLKVIVKTHTAVKETYDKPREVATVKEVNDVVNEPKSLDTKFEPVQITEVVEEGRVEKTEVYNTKPLEYSPVATDEKAANEEDLNEERESAPELNTGVLIRPFGLIGQSLEEVLNADRSLFKRRELVLK